MKVYFNKHYLSFYVVSKYNIRIVDAKTGLTFKMLDQIVDSENGVEITDFSLDHTHRKFYTGDTAVNNY